MRNLLNFLSRYSNLIVFLILEAVSVWLLVNAGGYHSSGFVSAVRGGSQYIDRKANSLREYIGLREKNLRLAEENLKLRNRVELLNQVVQATPHEGTVTLPADYNYILARVVNTSVNKQHNFITLDKGRNDGVEPDMALAGPDGVAGIIISVSDNFSYAMSVLNLDFRMSARLRKNSYYGSLRWDGYSVRQAGLYEIPYHVDVSPGDTVETSGYSAVFPPGLLVGTVADVDDSGGDFYKIVIDLTTDFRKLDYLYIIRNRRQDEQKSMENGGL